MEQIDDEDDNQYGYCKSCGACGETGCCSPFKCLKKAVKNNAGCMFGEEYLKDVEFYYTLGQELYELILKNGNKKNVQHVNKMADELWNRIYGSTENGTDQR